jgi:DNA-directed RNA polymerase alpha subunit
MKLIACPRCGENLELSLDFSLHSPAPASQNANGAWRDTPLNELELSVRAANCLDERDWSEAERGWVRTGRYATAGKIDDAPDYELLSLPNFGKVSLREVREVLARLKEATT